MSEESEERITFTLNSKECAEIALYMYKEYIEEMNKPQVSIPSFPNWLKRILQANTNQHGQD